MRKKNKQAATQPGAQSVPSPEQTPVPTPEEIVAEVASQPVEFPTELVENILADLESNAAAVQSPVEQAADIPSDASVESAPVAIEETVLPESETDVPVAAAAFVSPSTDDEASQEEPQQEHSESPILESEKPDEPIPPIAEESLAVLEENVPSPEDEMGLFERARYHARMRRREQTRIRRENARRGTRSTDVPYQPMTPSDIRLTLIRLAVAAVFLVLGVVFRQSATAALILNLIAFLITVFPVAATVARNITHGQYFSEYLLIFVASLGAFLLGFRTEATFVLILHNVGKILSDMVLGNTHKTLSKQIDYVPQQASIVNMQGEERRATPGEIEVGDFIMIRSGERLPIDGVVLRGEGTVDDTVLTGDIEPIPVTKGAQVLAGSLYTGTLLLVRATHRFEDCGISQILRVQEESAERRASLENSVMEGASRYIPIVVVFAILLSVLPPLFHFGNVPTWVYRALTILVVSCPTALLISVPLSFTGGSGRLAQKGIQAKGSEAIEKLAELRMVVFDKTGTLTEGHLRVKDVQTTPDFNKESCLALAATAEQLSKHPVARAVVAAYEGVPQKISEFEEFPGRGVRARIGNRNLLVGNRKLMVSRGVKGVPDISGTVVYIAYEGDYAGAIVLEDTIRAEAADAITMLKSQGVLRTVILTGDTELPAQQTADAIGIDTVHAGLLPEEKASKMEFLLRTIPTDGTAAYVGDGVNDIEELKLADVGVAMGVAGSQQSADAANLLIMTNNLMRFADAVRISRQTHGVAMQNMILALCVKIALVLLTLFGITSMWQAVAADVVLTVLTVLNAARTQKGK